MGVQAVQNKDSLTVGDQWVIAVGVRDLDGNHSDTVAPVLTVTLPNGTTATPTLERRDTGIYRVACPVASAGRYVGSVAATGYGAASVAVYVAATTANGAMPDAEEVTAYLRDNGGSWEQADITGALAAEAQAQRDVCRIPAAYPASLREALLRRVQRNLAMRGQPYAVLEGAEAGAQFIPGTDPEVRRLERPYRKVVLA